MSKFKNVLKKKKKKIIDPPDFAIRKISSFHFLSHYTTCLRLSCICILLCFSRIYEKLMVHSDLSKAESWKRLTEEFVNSPLPNTDGTKVWKYGGSNNHQ